jgi:hypothetical protein
MFNEDRMLAPDRARNAIGSDNGFEYRLRGRVSADSVYEPASNTVYPEFVLERADLLSEKPAPIFKDWNKRGDFTRHYVQSVLLFASRALYLNEPLAEANKALSEMCQYHLDRPQTFLEIHSFPGALRHLAQLAQFYGPDGTRGKGRLSPETYRVMLATMWEWAKVKSMAACVASVA